MQRKFLLATVGVILLSTTTFAAGGFPGVFQSARVSNTQDCSIASDIMPAFCMTSGPGSFSAAVKSCAPGGMSMQGIYYGMMAMYGTLTNACTKSAAKYGGTIEGCIGQWTCYWNGGT